VTQVLHDPGVATCVIVKDRPEIPWLFLHDHAAGPRNTISDPFYAIETSDHGHFLISLSGFRPAITILVVNSCLGGEAEAEACQGGWPGPGPDRRVCT
jgi:hypothetical protein